jgi:hypothetical protein
MSPPHPPDFRGRAVELARDLDKNGNQVHDTDRDPGPTLEDLRVGAADLAGPGRWRRRPEGPSLHHRPQRPGGAARRDAAAADGAFALPHRPLLHEAVIARMLHADAARGRKSQVNGTNRSDLP